MRRLTAIVAVNEDGVIGANNRLPWRVKSDLAFFKRQTIGNVIIMGRRTYDSLGKCLPNRNNIVVTHGFAMFPNSKGCGSAGGIVEALAKASREKLKRQEVFIVGGESMYRQFAPFVDRYLITEIRKPVPDGDAHFDPDIIGDVDQWDSTIIMEGQANNLGDEADYKVFELNARNAKEFEERRSVAVETYFSRAKGRLLPSASISRLLATS